MPTRRTVPTTALAAAAIRPRLSVAQTEPTRTIQAAGMFATFRYV